MAECSLGTRCKITIPSHFQKFSHFALARARAVQDCDNDSLPTTVHEGTGAGSPSLICAAETNVSDAAAPLGLRLTETQNPFSDDEDHAMFEDIVERHLSDFVKSSGDQQEEQSPVIITAEGNSSEMDIRLRVANEKVRLTDMAMKVPLKGKSPNVHLDYKAALPHRSSGKVSVEEAKKQFGKIFRAVKSKVKEGEQTTSSSISATQGLTTQLLV